MKTKPIDIDPEIAARCEGGDQLDRFKRTLGAVLSEAVNVPAEPVPPKPRGRPPKKKAA